MKNAMRPALSFGLILISLVAPVPAAHANPSKAVRTEVPMHPTDGKYQALCHDMNVTGFDSEPMGGAQRHGYSAVIPMNASPEAVLMAPAEVTKREQRTMATASPDGSIVGIATSNGTLLMRCVGEKIAWTKPLKVAPTSVTTDASGNIYYAGLASGPQGTDIVLGKYTTRGAKAWETRIGGPGNQHEPVIRVAPGGGGAVYVMGVSAQVLPGQMSKAKGYRFVAKYDGAGKQSWLRQATDFGKPTTTIEVRKRNDGKKFVILSDDSTPSAFDVDALGNAYVATMPKGALDGKGGKRTIELARFVKLDASGKKVATGKASVTFGDAPTDRGLRLVLAAPDGQSVYLLLGRVVVKLDANGRAKWARTFNAAAAKGDSSEWAQVTGFADAVLRGNLLYLLSHHMYEFDDGTGLPMEHTLVTILETERGKPQQFRTYGVSDGETSIQLMPAGTIMITVVPVNMFTRPPATARVFEVSDMKAPLERLAGVTAAASGVASATAPLPVELPDKLKSGPVEEMCPKMPVEGFDRMFDVVDKRSQPLASGASPAEILNTADAIKRRDARGLIVGTTGNGIVGAVKGDHTTLIRCAANKYTWSVPIDVALSSLASDTTGNIYYAGIGGLSQNAHILLGKVTAKGKRAWTARIDGSGHQSEAQIRVSPDGKAVYVLGLSAGALKRQPGSAKGHRFVARYDVTGKQEWLVQSRELGKPTTVVRKTIGEFDGQPLATLTPDKTPSFIDVDGGGNVYVATGLAPRNGGTGAAPLANVVKLDAQGKRQWKATVKVDESDLPTLSRVLTSPNGEQIFLVAGPFITQLDDKGIQKWTRRLDTPPWVHPNPKMRTGKSLEIRSDAALQGGKLYVVLTSDGPGWGDGTLVVLDATEGKLKSARTHSLMGWASPPTVQIMPNGTIMVLTAHETFGAAPEGSFSTLWRLKDVKAPAVKR